MGACCAPVLGRVVLRRVVCGGCSVPPVVLGEVGQDVHLLVLLQQAVRRADVVVLQHRPVVVQDGRVRPAGTRTASVRRREGCSRS